MKKRALCAVHFVQDMLTVFTLRRGGTTTIDSIVAVMSTTFVHRAILGSELYVDERFNACASYKGYYRGYYISS